MRRPFAIAASAALLAAGCAANQERLVDAEPDPKLRADCLAADADPSTRHQLASARGATPWCRDPRDEAVIWRSEPDERMQLDLTGRDAQG